MQDPYLDTCMSVTDGNVIGSILSFVSTHNYITHKN